MFSAIVFWAFAGWIVIQLLYAALMFARFLSLPTNTAVLAPALRRPVSIVICAKDEADNLAANLRHVLQQDYKSESGDILYEVIVVNDCSSDASHQILSNLMREFPQLREVVITPETPRNVAGKKFALSAGVNAASYGWLLLTDADCRPASSLWLAHMAAPLAGGKEIVAGYPAHVQLPGILNKFIRWETTHTYLQLASYAMVGKPYLAIGRNLATTKAACLRTYADPHWAAVPTGDDDLLVKLNATKDNFALLVHPQAYTYSNTRETLRAWMKQKERHTSDGKYYSGNIQALLAVYGISQAAVWVYFAYLAFTTYAGIAALLLLVRCLVYWVLWAATARKLKEKNIIYFMPLFDIAWMLYNFAFLPFILKKNRQHWT